MGFDVTGRLLDILAALIVMIFVPMAWFAGCFEILRQEYAMQTAREFADEICCMGSITSETFDAYTHRMNCFGEQAVLQLSRTAYVIEPVYENGVFTGQVREYASDVYNDRILDILASKGKYAFNRGDIVRVAFYGKRGTFFATAVGCVQGIQSEPEDT